MPALPEPSPAPRDSSSALLAGLAAFLTWGLVPVYWKLLKSVPATEILAHRFVWTTLFLVSLLTWQRRWPEVAQNIRPAPRPSPLPNERRHDRVNWLVFIWAVNAGRIIETSLGYFMTPLVNVLLGALFCANACRASSSSPSCSPPPPSSFLLCLRDFPLGRASFFAAPLGLYGFLRREIRHRACPASFSKPSLLHTVSDFLSALA